MANQFEHLDAQDENSRLAQVGPEEQDPREFDAWQAQVAHANLQSEIYRGERSDITEVEGIETFRDRQ